MMFKIGVFDDERAQCELIEEKFEMYGDNNNIEFEVLNSLDYKLAGREKNKDKVVQWILNEQIDAIIIDYKTYVEYGFNGIELINYINTILIGFPCVILTAWKGDVVSTSLVSDYLIYDKSEVLVKSIFSEQFKIFIDKIINQINIFKNQLNVNEEKYKLLYDEYKNGSISEHKKIELEVLHRVLVSYDIIENISLDSNVKEIEKEIGDLISKIKSNL